MNKRLVIAIDGHSSCGKSTFAKEIAKRMGYIFIDTGAMYRAVTLFALESECFHEGNLDDKMLEQLLPEISLKFQYDDTQQRSFILLNGARVESRIRGIEVSGLVSVVSQNKKVRELLVALQQSMGRDKGVVMDGRDIGTTVFPDADLKIFMTASVEVRAQRRYDELVGKGEQVSLEQISENIAQRDFQDENRAVSPLKKEYWTIVQ